MKVLHAAETIKGGVATVIRLLMSSQINDKNFSEVKCLVPAEHRSELETIDDKNMFIFRRTGRNIISFIRFVLTFTRIIKSFKPDVVHLHSTFAGTLCRTVLLLYYPFFRPKIIYCPHGFSFLMKTDPIKIRMYIIVERMLSLVTDKIICVSKYEGDAGRHVGINKKKITVIYNGIKPIIYKKIYDNSPSINLLFIGRLDYQKGIDVLEKAMLLLPEDKYFLTIIGEDEKGIREKIIKKNIEYKGWLRSDNIIDYLKKADVLVIPSRWEGFAMVPLEAMNYSVPIIASKTTSLVEVVKENKTGLFFENENEASLATAILSVTKKQLKEYGEAGNTFLLNNFTAEKMVILTNKLYK